MQPILRSSLQRGQASLRARGLWVGTCEPASAVPQRLSARLASTSCSQARVPPCIIADAPLPSPLKGGTEELSGEVLAAGKSP